MEITNTISAPAALPMRPSPAVPGGPCRAGSWIRETKSGGDRPGPRTPWRPSVAACTVPVPAFDPANPFLAPRRCRCAPSLARRACLPRPVAGLASRAVRVAVLAVAARPAPAGGINASRVPVGL